MSAVLAGEKGAEIGMVAGGCRRRLAWVGAADFPILADPAIGPLRGLCLPACLVKDEDNRFVLPLRADGWADATTIDRLGYSRRAVALGDLF